MQIFRLRFLVRQVSKAQWQQVRFQPGLPGGFGKDPVPAVVAEHKSHIAPRSQNLVNQNCQRGRWLSNIQSVSQQLHPEKCNGLVVQMVLPMMSGKTLDVAPNSLRCIRERATHQIPESHSHMCVMIELSRRKRAILERLHQLSDLLLCPKDG
jgi:hypothetical protein